MRCYEPIVSIHVTANPSLCYENDSLPYTGTLSPIKNLSIVIVLVEMNINSVVFLYFSSWYEE